MYQCGKFISALLAKPIFIGISESTTRQRSIISVRTPQSLFGRLPEPFGVLWISARERSWSNNNKRLWPCSVAINFRFPSLQIQSFNLLFGLRVFTSSMQLDGTYDIRCQHIFDHCLNYDCIWWRISFFVKFNRLALSLGSSYAILFPVIFRLPKTLYMQKWWYAICTDSRSLLFCNTISVEYDGALCKFVIRIEFQVYC